MALLITRILRYFGFTNTVGVKTLKETILQGSTARAVKKLASSLERQPSFDAFTRNFEELLTT